MKRFAIIIVLLSSVIFAQAATGRADDTTACSVATGSPWDKCSTGCEAALRACPLARVDACNDQWTVCQEDCNDTYLPWWCGFWIY